MGHEVENYLKQWQEHLVRSEHDRMPKLLFDADLLEEEKSSQGKGGKKSNAF